MCDAKVSASLCDAIFGDTSARSIVISVSPGDVPACVGLAVDTGVKRTSLSVASSAHPCWLVSCLSYRLDRALNSLMQVEGWMYALRRIGI